ncbi:MAG: UBA/THIF-type NAD/FAD binding protein [uncultured bacterium]|nr:MAG: UBA/THIF-type NAD/FAD binding protein [uncultured bacterium]
MNFPERYDRNIRLFGAEGQKKLLATRCLVFGVGGLGSPIAQHLALLGVGSVSLIDDEELDETNRNRFIGARHGDPIPGSSKVALSGRLIQEINPHVKVTEIRAELCSEDAFEAVKNADVVFGCFDGDGPRAVLNELCAAYLKPYIDLASDVASPDAYGGRVCVSWDGDGCLSCLGELDNQAVQLYLQSDTHRKVRDRIYGVDRGALAEKGPSVSPLNGVVASLGVMEFMAAVTGMRRPFRLLNYRGHMGTVTVSKSDPQPGCFICKGIRGQGKDARVERYLGRIRDTAQTCKK